MLSITKEFLFDAAHTLVRRDLSQEDNQRLYGKCSRFHGHTYRLRITVSGDAGDDGMIISFSRLKDLVNEAVVHRYDHAFLNDLAEYRDVPATAENMVQHIFRVLDPLIDGPAARLESVVLYETPTSWAIMTR